MSLIFYNLIELFLFVQRLEDRLEVLSDAKDSYAKARNDFAVKVSVIIPPSPPPPQPCPLSLSTGRGHIVLALALASVFVTFHVS